MNVSNEKRGIMKKALWILTVALVTVVMIRVGRNALGNIWISREPDARYYYLVTWEIVERTAVILPVWLLSLLGLARSFLGENWFPFAGMIPILATKRILAAAAAALIGVSAAAAVYGAYTKDLYAVRYMVKERFRDTENILAWILFYGMLLYIEQWCLSVKEGRKQIAKKQVWFSVTILLTWILRELISCCALWYTPMMAVNNLNAQEDYFLWWFSMILVVLYFPLWFFCARGTIRLFGKAQWLSLSRIIPWKLAALAGSGLAGLLFRQILKYRACIAWTAMSDVPEYTQARAVGYLARSMIYGLMLFYDTILLSKQFLAARRSKRTKGE